MGDQTDSLAGKKLLTHIHTRTECVYNKKIYERQNECVDSTNLIQGDETGRHGFIGLWVWFMGTVRHTNDRKDWISLTHIAGFYLEDEIF